MILTASTFVKPSKISTQDTLIREENIIFKYVRNRISHPINDVFVIFSGSSYEIETDLSPKELTINSMLLSQSSFSKEWDNEDDEYWNNYL